MSTHQKIIILYNKL